MVDGGRIEVKTTAYVDLTLQHPVAARHEPYKTLPEDVAFTKLIVLKGALNG